MNNIVLFAGTTEGRALAERLAGRGAGLVICVATEYGETTLREGAELGPDARVMAGRLSQAEMAAMIKDENAAAVIDATHPYAAEVTKNIAAACDSAGTEYIRVLRGGAGEERDGCVYVANTDEAAAYLDSTEGNILLTVGSKELRRYGSVRGCRERIYARVLPIPGVLEDAAAAGFDGKRLICMQGPFSRELNTAMIHAINAKYLVTKDTGSEGGFNDKVEAALEAGAVPVIIRRPSDESGMSVSECEAYLERTRGLRRRKEVSIIGIGPGSSAQMTVRAEELCRRAELFIGAPRVLESLARFGARAVEAIAAADIARAVEEAPERRIAAVMSGDVGFCSGAKKLLPLLAGYSPELVPGISSIAALCARTGETWDDAELCSAHGRDCNFVARVRRRSHVIMLSGGDSGVRSVLNELREYGLGHVSVIVAENLSYPDERITSGSADELADSVFGSLALLSIRNPRPETRTAGLPDDAFLRAEVPMTKSEVRAVAMSKLRVGTGAVCWDVGAGTGSVSIEMACAAEDGVVWAVERNPEACALIERNKRHLGAPNVRVVEGSAPDALTALPPPDRVFIGGSGGELRSVIEAALAKNPEARVVITAVTAESIAEAVECVNSIPAARGAEIIEMSAARGRKAGRYHLMTALNPIFIFSFGGGTEEATEA